MNDSKPRLIDKKISEKIRKIEKYRSSVIIKDNNIVIIDGSPYKLIKNYNNGFQIDKLRERFSPILTKYDYIVGDIGYDQLRLRGFYSDDNHKALNYQKINQLQDYLYEYCDFGCSYFILKNLYIHRHCNKHLSSRRNNMCRRINKGDKK